MDGNTYVVSFGSLSNTADQFDATAEDTVAFAVQFYVRDISVVQNGTSLVTGVTVETGGSNPTVGPASHTYTVHIASLAVALATAPLADVDGGDVLAMQATATAVFSSAYDGVLHQSLPSGAQFVAASASCVTACSSGWAVAGNNTDVVVTFDALHNDGMPLTVTWQIVLAPIGDVHPNATLLFGLRGFYDTAPAGSGAAAGRVLSTNDAATSVVLRSPTVALAYVSSDIAETDAGDVTPSETVLLRITIEVPEGTMNDVTLTVVASASLTLVNASLEGMAAGVTTTPGVARVDDTFVVTMATITNNNNNGDIETLTLTTAAQLPFEPSGLYAVPTITVTLENAELSAGVGAAISFVVVEPALELVEGVPGGYSGDAGDNVTYAFQLQHDVSESDCAAQQITVAYNTSADVMVAAGVGCVLPSALAVTLPITSAQCTGHGASVLVGGVVNDDSVVFVVPLLLSTENFYGSVTAVLDQTVSPARAEVNRIEVGWSSSPLATQSSYTTSLVQTTTIALPTVALATGASSDASSYDGVAVGEDFEVVAVVHLPESTGNVTVQLQQLSTHAVFTNVSVLAVGGNIAGTTAGAVSPMAYDAGTRTMTVHLGVLTNAFDNADATVADVVRVSFFLRVVDSTTLNGWRHPGTRTALGMSAAVVVDDVGVAAAAYSINASDTDMRLNLQMPSFAAESTACAGHVDGGDTLTFQALAYHHMDSKQDAYGVTITCTLPPVLVLDTASVAVSQLLFGGPTSNGAPLHDAPIVNATHLAVTWHTWPLDVDAATTTFATVQFQAAVVVTVPSGTRMHVVCGVASQTVPVTSANPARVRNATSGPDVYHVWQDSAETFHSAVHALVASVLPPAFSPAQGSAAVGEHVQVRVDVWLPEGTTELVVSASYPAELTYVSATVAAVGDALAVSDLAVDDAVPEYAVGLVRFVFGIVTNTGDQAVDARDNVSVVLTFAVADEILAVEAALLAVAVSSAPNASCPSASGTAVVRVVEPTVSMAVDIALQDGEGVLVDAGDNIVCTVTAGVASASPGVLAYDVSIVGTNPNVYLSITESTGSTFRNASMVQWDYPTLSATGDAPLVLQYVATVDQSVFLGSDVVKCTAEVRFDSHPVGAAGGPGRAYVVVAESSNLTIAKPEIAVQAAASSVDGTVFPAVTINESFAFAFAITLPEGITTLQFDVTPTAGAAGVVVVEATASVGGGVTCAAGGPTLSNTSVDDATVVLGFGSCQTGVGARAAGTNTIMVEVSAYVADVAGTTGDAVDFQGTLSYGSGELQAFEERAVNITYTIVEPQLALDVGSAPPEALASGDALPYAFTLAHLPNSTAPAYGVVVTVSVDPQLTALAVTSHADRVTTLDVAARVVVWTLPAFDTTSTPLVLTLTTTVSQNTTLGSTIAATNVSVEYTSVPADHGTRGRERTVEAVAEVASVVAFASLAWTTVATSDAYTVGAADVGIGERVTLAAAVYLPAATPTTVLLSFAGLDTGRVDASVAGSAVLAAGVHCEHGAAAGVLGGDGYTFSFGHCTNANGQDNSTVAIDVAVAVVVNNVAVNTAGATLTTTGVLEYTAAGVLATTDNQQVFTVVEPTMLITLTPPARHHVFLESPPVELVYRIAVAPSFGHNVTLAVAYSANLRLDTVEVVGTAAVRAQSEAAGVVTLGFGSVLATEAIAVAFHYHAAPTATLMSSAAVGVDLVVRSSPASDADFRVYTDTADTTALAVFALSSASSVVATSLAATTGSALVVGEAAVVHTHTCVKGYGLVYVNVTVPAADVVFQAGSVFTSHGANVVWRTPVATTMAGEVVMVVFNVSNTVQSATMDAADCFDANITVIVVGGSAGDVHVVTIDTVFEEASTTASVDLTVLEPALVGTMSGNVTTTTRTEIGDALELTVWLHLPDHATAAHAYEVEAAVPLHALDTTSVVVVSSNCTTTLSAVVGDVVRIAMSEVAPGLRCVMVLAGRVGVTLAANAVEDYVLSATYKALPPVLENTFGRNYTLTVPGPIYRAADLTFALAIVNNTAQDYTGDSAAAPVGAEFVVRLTVTVPLVRVADLAVRVVFADSALAVFDAPPVVEDSDGAAVALASFASVGGMFDGTFATMLRDTPDDPAGLAMVFRLRVRDTSDNVNNRAVAVTANATYHSTTREHTVVATVVEPLLVHTVTCAAANADAGDVLTYTHCMAHTGASGSAAFNVSTTLTAALLLNRTAATPVPISATLKTSGSSVDVLSGLGVTDTGPGVGGAAILESYPVLQRDEQLCLDYRFAVVQDVFPRADLLVRTGALTYASMPADGAGGRAYAVGGAAHTVVATDLAPVAVALDGRTATGTAAGTSTSGFFPIGDAVVLTVVAGLPEATVGNLSVAFGAALAQFPHALCLHAVGGSIAGGWPDPNCTTGAVDSAGYQTSVLDVLDAVNVYDNVVDAGDDVVLRVTGSIADSAANRNGTRVTLSATATTGDTVVQGSYDVIIGEPSVESVCAITPATTEVTDGDTWLLADSSSTTAFESFTFDVTQQHAPFATVPAYDVRATVSVNATATNVSVVAVDHTGTAGPTRTNMLPVSEFVDIGTLRYDTLALGDAVAHVIQVQLPTAMNLPGDHVCVRVALVYTSLPATTTPGYRTYTRTDVTCFEAGLSFSPAGSESSAFSTGALAGTVLSVVVLLLLLVVVVAKRQQRRHNITDKDTPLAAIEIKRLRTLSPTHRKHSVKLVKVKKTDEEIAREKEVRGCGYV